MNKQMHGLQNEEQLGQNSEQNALKCRQNTQYQQVQLHQPQQLIIRSNQNEQNFIITFVRRSKLARCVFVTFIFILFVVVLNTIIIGININRDYSSENPDIKNQPQTYPQSINDKKIGTNIALIAQPQLQKTPQIKSRIPPMKEETKPHQEINSLPVWKQSATDQHKIEKNTPYDKSPTRNKYPEVIPKVSPAISEKDLFYIKELLQQANLTQTTVQIGRQYLLLGLSQPQQQLIQRQKSYYQEKYGLSKITDELPFCVVILGFNNLEHQRYKIALNSVFRQEYQNYRVFYIDDASTDGTGAAVQAYINKFAINPDKFKIFHNKENKKAMENHFIAGKQYCKPEQIYFMAPDGDDALIGTQVFKLYNYYFQTKDIWLAWGNYMMASGGTIGGSRPMPEQVIQQRRYRSFAWITSHPKAFYTKLWNQVKKEDLIDSQTGDFYKVAQDLGMMYPMIELAGRKIVYIPEITYLYIDNNSGSEMVLYLRDIRRVTEQVKQKDKYPQISCLFVGSVQNCIQPKQIALKKIKLPEQKPKIKRQSKLIEQPKISQEQIPYEFPRKRILKPCLNCSNYPKQASSVYQKKYLRDKHFENFIKNDLTQKDITTFSFQLAQTYAKNRLLEPTQQLKHNEIAQYQKKYNISEIKIQLPLCVVVLSYNNVQNDRYKFTLNSIFRQKYSNYKVVYIDDASTDQTGNKAKQYIDQRAPSPQKFTIIINSFRKSAMGNNYLAGQTYCQEDTIYIALDGDDALVGTQTFKLYNYFFQKKDIWFAWSQYLVISADMLGSNREMDNKTKKQGTIRQQQFFTSHLKAFVTKLWRKVDKEDLLNQNGKFIDPAQDLAMTFPLIQMSRQRVAYIPEVCYLYLDNYSGSDNKNLAQAMSQTSAYIRSLPKKDKVDCLYFKQDGSCQQARYYLLQKIQNKKQSNGQQQ